MAVTGRGRRRDAVRPVPRTASQHRARQPGRRRRRRHHDLWTPPEEPHGRDYTPTLACVSPDPCCAGITATHRSRTAPAATRGHGRFSILGSGTPAGSTLIVDVRPASRIVDARFALHQRRCPTCSTLSPMLDQLPHHRRLTGSPSSTPSRFPIVDARSPRLHHQRPPCSFPTVDAIPCRSIVGAQTDVPIIDARPAPPPLSPPDLSLRIVDALSGPLRVFLRTVPPL